MGMAKIKVITIHASIEPSTIGDRVFFLSSCRRVATRDTNHMMSVVARPLRTTVMVVDEITLDDTSS